MSSPAGDGRLGERVRDRRELLGLTQLELAELAGGGLSASYLSRVEAGERNPSLSLVIAIAAGLRTTAETLVYGDELPTRCAFCGRRRR